MRRRVFLLVVFLVSVVWISCYRYRQATPRALPRAEGEHRNRLESEDPARPDMSPSFAAVLLLAEDQSPAAAASALESAGIPFTITREPSAAVPHPLIIIPFSEQAVPLSSDLLELLGNYVRHGGTLVVQAPPKDPWGELTGLARSDARRSRRQIIFDGSSDETLRGLRLPELRRIPLAGAASEAPWTRALETRAALGGESVAVYDTGETAILRRRLGTGRVYTLGVDLRDVVLRPHAGRSFDAGRTGQGLEPAADVWAFILLGWYEEAFPSWIRLRAVPSTATVVLVLSHALETRADVAALAELSALETSLGARATWFFRAGATGVLDEATTLDPRIVSAGRALAATGHELASHAILHADDFESLPEGRIQSGVDGYRPRITVDGHAQAASMLQEAAVSRARLERFFGRGVITGLRTPRLAYPTTLASSLKTAGYLYDSSLSGRSCLSTRPFFLPAYREFERETDMVEIPVAFEDEVDAQRPDAGKVLDALLRGTALEATVAWALRPSAPGSLGVVRRVLSDRPAGTVVLRLNDVARFWRARHAARFALEPAKKGWTLKLELPEGSPGLSFELSRPIVSCASLQLKVSCSGRLLTIEAEGAVSGSVALRLH